MSDSDIIKAAGALSKVGIILIEKASSVIEGVAKPSQIRRVAQAYFIF